ncbi:MAG: outer membrane lipoprotein carrier protein LolA [Bdellovibrio sp.]|nr:outer membrane lipoprotein carrier protein LolA [Bdellovibrio sp.]
MKFLFILGLLAMSFLGPVAFASAQLTKILEKYSKSSALEVQIKKIDEKITLGSKSTSQGTMKYAAGKIYLILEGDVKTEFFYKDKKITLVEHPDQDFDKEGKRKVTILSKNKPVLIEGLLKLFSNTKSFLKEFKVISEKEEDGSLIVSLEPPQKNLKSFSLVINKKEKRIDSIIFVDDVDTKTTLELSNFKPNKKNPQSTFEFEPKPSDEVIPE